VAAIRELWRASKRSSALVRDDNRSEEGSSRRKRQTRGAEELFRDGIGNIELHLGHRVILHITGVHVLYGASYARERVHVKEQDGSERGPVIIPAYVGLLSTGLADIR
jgi:hypothetical protein